jgi:hypothetical protein
MVLPAFQVVRMTDFEPALRRHLEAGFRRYEFGFCGADDWEALRLFLRDHWSATHPYVVSPELVRWMLRDPETGRYNCYLARHRASGEIHACATYLLTSQFDPALPVRDIWPGLWRSVPGAAPGLGGECLRRLMDEIRPRSIGGLGMSRNTVDILPRLGWTLGVMDHHYLLNPEIRDFRLVVGARPATPIARGSSGASHRLRDLDADEVRSLRIDGVDPFDRVPAKTGAYLCNRYARHPVYTYRLLAIENHHGPLGVLVSRTTGAEGARAVRLVDFVGRDEAWTGLGPALANLVGEERAEYADLYSAGLDTDLVRAAGMIPHPPGDPVIIPNYFEPFERMNKVLDYGYIAPPGVRYRMFKGDSDQDRPNLIPPAKGVTPGAG